MKIFTISIKRLSGIVHFLILVLFALFFFYTSSAKGQDTACSQSLPPQDSIPHIPIKGESDNQTSSSTSCQNSDFSLGTFKNWSGCSGTWCADTLRSQTRCAFPNSWVPFNPPCSNPGQPWNNNPTGGHFNIQNPGQDPCISALSKVFPGDAHSALIGNRVCSNNNAGGYVDQLTYQIAYDPNNSFFIYRCAVVLANIQDPTHNTSDRRPRFTFEIKDHTTGTLIDPVCGFYDLWPGDGITTWNETGPPLNFYWKDWSTIGIDFNALSGITTGQILDVVFNVHGCGFQAHTGYAYISAFCGSMTIQVAGCEGSGEVTLTGPAGFTQYLWQGPYCPTCPPNPPTYTGNPITLTAAQGAVTGNTFDLTLTALNGCQVQNVQQIIAFTNVTAGFTHGSACVDQGMQFTDQSTSSQNQITAWDWDFGDGTPIQHQQNPVHPYSAANTYTVSLIAYSSDGCSDTTTNPVTVDPLPVITNTSLRQRICNNTNTNITLTSDISNTLYTWTTTVSSPNLSGYSDNPATPGSFSNQTLVNSGNTLDSVIYHFTPHSGSCTGPVKDFVVTVCPVPQLLNSPLLKTICDSLNTNIILTSNMDSTRFTWTCSANAGNNLSGYSDYNTLPGILNISQVVYNSGYNVDTLHYHITGNAYGCDGPANDYSVVVFPLPDLSTAPLNKSLCSQDYTNVLLTSDVAGTQFTWTCTSSGPGITGWANNPFPSTFLNQQLFNSTTAPGLITYYITPHANNCDGHVYQYTVTVKPIPVVTNTVNPTVCSGGTTNIILLSNIAGSTFSWTATGSSPNVNGYSNSSGPVIAQTLINSGFNNESVLYSVTPFNNGCSGISSGITVTVFPVADVYFTPGSQVLCSGQQTNLALDSHVAGSTFNWTATGSSGNVNGFLPGSGNSIAQILNNTGTSVETVTYNAQPTANGCPGTTGSAVVTVNPVPVVSYTLCHDNITTTAAQPMKLTGGIPIGGNYTGAGVNGGMFNPGVAGIGNHTIIYNYSNYLGCSRSATQVITVSNAPAFLCSNMLTDIRDNKQYPTVKLGTHCWMATNLNFGSQVLSSSMQRDNCLNEKYCYGDNAANCTTYGGLYQWDELMRYDNMPAAQGFCPPGWHVPTENEWNSLFLLYISNGFAGSPLKYTGYSGFNAFLSGVRHNNVNWDFLNFAIMYWSSTEEAPTKAWAHGMNTINPSVSYYPSSKTHAFAVRCVQD